MADANEREVTMFLNQVEAALAATLEGFATPEDGPRFRRVPLASASQRGGLLRQGSILMVTSYATRTSPVLRGKWVLENLLGTPPPPPPPNVPALDDNAVSETLPVR